MHIYANYSKLTLYHALSHETQQPVGVIERENKNEGYSYNRYKVNTGNWNGAHFRPRDLLGIQLD